MQTYIIVNLEVDLVYKKLIYEDVIKFVYSKINKQTKPYIFMYGFVYDKLSY